MSRGTSKAARVGIRELRQNLSVYVHRVRETGQEYEVTERGEPVARLLPLEGRATRVQRMMADGRISLATRALDDIPSPVPSASGRSLSGILIDQREEETR
jgi:prevent-host-death family protein